MLTGLKVLSLTCKCVFNRLGHYVKEVPQGIELYPKELNFEGLEMQKWNLPTECKSEIYPWNSKMKSTNG